MIYTILIFLSIVVSVFAFQWRNYKKTVKIDESPFDLTEFAQKMPTPTPSVEKKKRIRKPKSV
jgi:tellurite resistance protein TehA-like permease